MKHHKRSAFSLFEAVICIIVLGVIGIICNSILLDMSKNLAMQRTISEPAYTIALLKIENLLQSAFPQSLTSNGKPLTHQNLSLEFTRLDTQILSGGSDKNSSYTFLQGTLIPKIALAVSSMYDATLTLPHTQGWMLNSEIALFPSPQRDKLQLSIIKSITQTTLTLSTPPAQTPRIILPVHSHKIWLSQDTLLLDGTPLALGVSSFLTIPHTLPNNELFLELQLCFYTSPNVRCQKGGVWITSPIERIL